MSNLSRELDLVWPLSSVFS